MQETPIHRSSRRVAVALVGSICCLVFGCGGKDAPAPEHKDAPAPGAGDAQSPAPAEPQQPAQAASDLTPESARVYPDIAPAGGWIVPEGWSVSEQEAPMRVVTFMIDDPDGAIDAAVTRFPGDVGGMLANVNRWRTQAGLMAVTEEELDGLMETFEVPGFRGALMRIEGESTHILAASLFEIAENRTWFVRTQTGSEEADRIERSVFAFARSFRGE